MKKKRTLWACLLVLLSLIPLVIVSAQAGVPVDPYEGYDDFDRAYGPLQLGPQYAAYLNGPYDKDFYYFDVDQVGTIRVDLANIPTNHTYGIILYDRDRDIVDLDVEGRGDKHLSFDMSFSGRYYLMVDVRAGAYDPYQPYLLRVTTTQGGGSRQEVTGTDSFEDNNTYQTAYGPLESGKVYEAYCWSQGDRDCYYITLSANSTVKAELTGVCADCDYDFYLVDSAEQILAGSENGQGQDESLSVNLPPGTYYFVVHPYVGYSQQVPYRLTVTYNETAGGRQGPQPGNEAAWAKAQIEDLGYTILYEPGVIELNDGSLAVVAIEVPVSFDLRIEDNTTWRQAIDTWGVLINAFDVHHLWIGLTYQSRYVVYYAVSSGDFGRYIRGEVSRQDLPISYGVWDQQEGGWVSDARDFMDKNFQ